MRSKAPSLPVCALFAILALAAGAAFAADGGTAAAPPVSPAVSQPALQPTPAPLFLSTYTCTKDVLDPCTGQLYTTCSIDCNVGQHCGCVVTYGKDTTDCGVYIVRVGRPFCF